MLGVTGTQPSAHQFDALWNEANGFFRAASKNLNFYNVLYSVELGILQDLVVFPIGITFLIFETAKILMDVIVCIGPFLLAGYLIQATRGIAGVTVTGDAGFSLSLDRGPGGLAAKEQRAGVRPQQWRMFGTSRGEGGILGDGVRQALLRDPTYGPALHAARSFAP